RKRGAYPNLLLVEMGAVPETARAAERGLEVAAQLLGARAAAVGLKANGGNLRPAARRGLSPEQADEIFQRSTAETDAAMQRLGSITVELAHGEPFHEAFGLVPAGVDRIVFVPVIALGNPVGVIVIGVDRKNVNTRDEQLLMSIGVALGLSLENLRQRDELREGQERLERVVTSAPLVLFALDRDGAYTLIEGRGLDVLGIRAEQVLGRSVFDVFTGRPEVTGPVKRALAGEDLIASAEFSGAVFEARLTPMRDAAGQVAGVIGVATDISERRQAESALRASEERYRALVENASDGIFAIDMENRLLSVNAALADKLGYNADELPAMDIAQIIPPDQMELAEAMTARKVAEGGRTAYEIDVVCKDGTRVPLEVSSWLAFEDGIPVAVHGIARDISERRQSDTAIRESEALYRTLVETSPDAVLLTRASGEIVKANRPAALLLGFNDAEELSGKSAIEFVAESDRQRILQDIQAGFARGVIRNVEYMIARGDGTAVPVEISLSAVATEGGEPRAFVAVARDVTARRQAEEALRESEEKYRDLVENSNEIIYTLDASGVVTYISPAVKQLGGYEAEEVIGKTSLSFVHHDDLGDVAASFQRTVGGHPEPSEYRLRKKSGDYTWVQTSSRPIFDGERIAGLRGLIVDIDKRKRAEEALGESEERYRDLFENASDLVYEHSLGGRYLSVNRAVEDITGYTPEEVLGKKWADFVAPEHLSRLSDMAVALARGDVSTGFEIDVVTKAGQRVPLEVRPQIVYQDGKPVAIRGIARDISERKRIDAALRAIVEGASAGAGDEFFHSLVQHLAEVVGSRYAFLGKVSGEDRVSMLAVWTGEGFGENFEYELKGTPCENVVDRQVCVFPRDVQSLFPADVSLAEMGVESYMGAPLFDSAGRALGVLAVMDNRPMEPSENQRSILTIFAARAGVELERRDAEQALQASEERYRNLVNTAPDVIYTLALDATLTSLNPAFEAVTGWKPEDWIGKHFGPLVHPEDLSLAVDLFKQVLAGQAPSYELRIKRPDGDYVVGEFTSTPLIEDGELKGAFGIARDITERKKAEAMIRELAYHDGLTGLPNRALFEDRLGVALAQAHRRRQMLAVMFLDLDRFKIVNDTLGHSGGDKLLKGVAEDLKAIVREGDTVARVGGDEFTLLFPAIESQADAIEVAERILDILRGPRLIDSQEFSITTSIGMTIYPQDGKDTDALLRNADTAMYRAKERGRDNVQLYTPAMNAGVMQRLSLENDLRHALERGELRVYYQPIAEAATGRVVATEALVRWEHPERGIVEPDEFIPFAEETGLIVPIGEWVLRESMRQNLAWQQAGYRGLVVGVNLSARQLQQEDMVSTVSRLLRDTGLPPELLQLEITEGAVMKNVELIIAMLHQIRRMGIGISLDDFGTGYSSLSYLKRFPIDSVKIDRSFVRDIATDPNDAAIVTTVIAMARSLNLKVIAEGV
ncbi:MAG TPA: PAS domain S-box protein, partial [Dehalococcoidia bacterium]|nr:PAS domain S-box protein [Dehalococcoidia bacterium]